MTLEEAKDILLKLENLVSKTNRMYKKGERMDSTPFLKLHRKRISMFDVQEEAECIVREGDLEFYQAWADRVLEKFPIFAPDFPGCRFLSRVRASCALSWWQC